MPPPAKRPRARAPRVRRDPQEARAIILDAAEKLFAAHGPDAVGLKDVAREAGVSHALVSHYFGTFAGLVDAALERRAATVRARVFERLLADEGDIKPGELLDRLWESANDPAAMRLGAWALLSGRAESEHFFPRRVQGLRMVVDALEKRMRARRGEKIAREDIELVVTIGVAFTYGFAITRGAIHAALGHGADDPDDATLRARFADILEQYLLRKR